MLAKVARQRSSWLRSRVASPHVSRLRSYTHIINKCMQEATGEKEEHAVRKTLQIHGDKRSLRLDEFKSVSVYLKPHEVVTLVADEESREGKVVEHINVQYAAEKDVQVEAKTDEVLTRIATTSSLPAQEHVTRARESLQKMAKELADPCAAVAGETSFQRARRQLKTATGKLDRMLYAMRVEGDFYQVEAVALVWEEEFPQFVGQHKHWSVICEHYALALNYQRRFQDVVDKFSNCYEADHNHVPSAQEVSLLTPRLAQSIFTALGHLRDAARALQLLKTMECHDIHVTKISYFHVLTALLHDERFTDFDKVLRICEEIVTAFTNEIVPLSLLPIIMMTAAACGESERAMKFYSHPPDMFMSTYTESRFETCFQQLDHLDEVVMMMEMYRNLMVSVQASHGLKTRVSNYLLRNRVESITAATRNARLGTACKILELMNQHKVRANCRTIYPLLHALVTDPSSCLIDGGDDDNEHDEQISIRVQCAKDLHNFFARYSYSLDWNAFALCEAVFAGVSADRADLVDDLCMQALRSGMPIKYAALEKIVVYYFRLGSANDFDRVSRMVQALRLNEQIPLGIALTQIGMIANFSLHRYDEVVTLFEDYLLLVGKRRRVFERRIILQTAHDAYTCLGRGDVAIALQGLLNQHDTLLDESEMIEADEAEGDEAEGDEAKADIQLDEQHAEKNKLIDDNTRNHADAEQERVLALLQQLEDECSHLNG